MWVYSLTLVAALLVGGASVIQQRSAAEAPPEYNLSPRLLVWLVQRPLWLLGAGVSIAGNLVFSLAVSRGNVALAEALLVTRLLFALQLAAAWGRHTVPLRDWGGAVAITVGLVGFILAARPQSGTGEEVADATWVLGGGSLVAIVLAMTVIARRLGPTWRASLLGAGAGAMFGLQASLTRSTFLALDQVGLVGLLTTWNLYAVVTVAAFGTLLLQSAYEVAPLPASYPAVVTAELLAGIGTGVGILGGEIQLSTAGLALWLLCLLVMVGGIYVLTTSPLVTGELDRLIRRDDIGQARRSEAHLEHTLRRAERDLDAFEARLAHPRALRRSRRHLQRDIVRIEQELERLDRLRRDIDLHRQAERERLGVEFGAVPGERELEEWERAVDSRAERLRAHADRIEEHIRMLDRRDEGPPRHE